MKKLLIISLAIIIVFCAILVLVNMVFQKDRSDDTVANTAEFSFTGTVVEVAENSVRIYTEDFPEDRLFDIHLDEDKLQNHSEIKEVVGSLKDKNITVFYDGNTFDLGPPFVFAEKIVVEGEANAEEIQQAQAYLTAYSN